MVSRGIFAVKSVQYLRPCVDLALEDIRHDMSLSALSPYVTDLCPYNQSPNIQKENKADKR